MSLEPKACYRAVLARDARYDGRFFTCVRTTGIYCRPICPTRPPKFENCVFVPTAAAAQEAGFRPCLRCRPESSPQLDAWQGTLATVSRAWKLIEAGALDEGNVASLAERLGIGDRQLRRLLRQHVGASPITMAQTRRVLLAKQLIHQTQLSMIDVALASGFGSVRRFNETFQKLYGRPPSAIRRRELASSSADLSILLPYQSPYDWQKMLEFLRTRAIAEVETISGNAYMRTVDLDGQAGTVCVSDAPEQSSLRVVFRIPRLEVLPSLITRLRRQFDLAADPHSIARVLSQDADLAPLVRARPGLRVPGGWDGFEVAVRAVIGQQITLKGATRLLGQLAIRLGSPLPLVEAEHVGLSRLFPRPEQLQREAIRELGIPMARVESLLAIAAACGANPQIFDPQRDLAESVASLRSLRGVGEWTAQYIAMRAMGESDAFLAGDVGLQRRLARGNQKLASSQLLARAEGWRPWRAYALLHVWMADKEALQILNQEPDYALST
ncbi:MAG TPA: AlkA N-terminal domain-containing protein [Pirellulales bacterium]|nr:AlkA N-terminal domain-containing protein [Pirellulales bacterium]